MAISFEFRQLSIPFRFSYGHSKASHKGVELLICIARNEMGQCGYGEAVPRIYVTGETPASVWADLPKLHRLFSSVTNLETLKETIREEATKWKGAFPSCAFCCVELALTDLFSRQTKKPFYAALGTKNREELSYSGSIGMGKKSFLKTQLVTYRAWGLKSFKVKVGSTHDLESLKMVRKVLGNQVRIFVDANGAWDKETAIQKMEAFHALGVWGIEEPLRRKSPDQKQLQYDCESTLTDQHYQANAWLRERSPMDLIADESVISPRSLQRAIDHSAFDVVDIRLSKLGGAALSATAIKQAVGAGMKFYIGAMVGESAILATAGSSLGAVYADHLLIQGHSHGALHRKKIMKGGMKMRWGGRVKIMDSVGLGVRRNHRILDAFTLKQMTLK